MVDKFEFIYSSRRIGTLMLMLTGDREKEMLARYTENLHLQEILNAKGNKVELYELKGFDHGTMLEPACLLLGKMIHRTEKKKEMAVAVLHCGKKWLRQCCIAQYRKHKKGGTEAASPF